MRISLVVGILLLSRMVGSLIAGDVDAAVERALPYLEKEGTWWIEEKKCVTCHHTSFLIWAKDLALDAGFSVDEATLSEQRKWTWEFLLTPKETKEEEGKPKPDPVQEKQVKGDGNVEGVNQVLFSASARHLPAEVTSSLLDIVRANRQKGIDWKPGGQLPRQKRPVEETKAISYQWALASLPSDDVLGQESDQVDAKLVAKTNEWYALNLILNQSPGALKQLMERQNEDGGWSWKDGEPSDPSGTGQALIALGRSGQAKESREAVDRARKFLIESQEEDGHWETMSTKDRKESTRISDFWGTAWAVIGLLEVRE